MSPRRGSSSAPPSSRRSGEGRVTAAGHPPAVVAARVLLDFPGALAVAAPCRVDGRQPLVAHVPYRALDRLRPTLLRGREPAKITDVAHRADLLRRGDDAPVERERSLLGGEIQVVVAHPDTRRLKGRCGRAACRTGITTTRPGRRCAEPRAPIAARSRARPSE